jgi:hypothetical protein
MKKTPLSLVTGSTAKVLEPPRKLGKAGLALWRSVQTEYQITDCGGVELLMQACLAADRVDGLAVRIEADGEVIRTKTGLKAHPAIRDELAGRAFICRTLARLGLNLEIIKPVGNPGYGGIGWTGPE